MERGVAHKTVYDRREYSDYDSTKESGHDFMRGNEIFIFSTTSKTALKLTQSSIQWIPGSFFLCVCAKRPGREAGHSPPSNNEAEYAWNYTSNPRMSSWCGAIKRKDNFILPFWYYPRIYDQVLTSGFATKILNALLMSLMSIAWCHTYLSWFDNPSLDKISINCTIKRQQQMNIG
jgi:hypothetical protein